jgi:thiamine-phosphate pyrophosphorylase
VHLRSDDVSPTDVRRLRQTVLDRVSPAKPPSFLIAVSCHSEDEVRAAAAERADYAVFAPVFHKKEVKPAGLDTLQRACRYPIPVFALGGVTIENAESCLQAGAAGIAGIKLFQENRISDVVRQLRQS